MRCVVPPCLRWCYRAGSEESGLELPQVRHYSGCGQNRGKQPVSCDNKRRSYQIKKKVYRTCTQENYTAGAFSSAFASALSSPSTTTGSFSGADASAVSSTTTDAISCAVSSTTTGTISCAVSSAVSSTTTGAISCATADPSPAPAPAPAPGLIPILLPAPIKLQVPDQKLSAGNSQTGGTFDVGGTSFTSVQAQLQLRLLEEEEALERKFLEKRYHLLMAVAADPSVNGVADKNRANNDGLGEPLQHSTPLPSPIPRDPSNPVPPRLEQSHHSETPSFFGDSLGPGDQPISSRYHGHEPGFLSRSQIAARHAVSRDLPTFTGDPEEWPLFFATFQSTTRICGFTAEENMIRLNKCIQGGARTNVLSQLLHPKNVDGVISTLKMLYGRPEIIVQSLIRKIQALPPPKADKLSTLVDFAIAVRNMVATIEACELNDYLFNVSLLQELVERLPSMIKLSWAVFRQQMARVTLKDFSDWLYRMAEAASIVTVPAPFSDDFKNKRNRKGDGGYLHTHCATSQSPPKNPTDHEHSDECPVCKGDCESVVKCSTFLGLDHSNRWAALREHNLCRRCLKSHRGFCKSNVPCGKNGCPYKHHALLHNDTPSGTKPPPTGIKPANTPEGRNPASIPEGDCNTHRSPDNAVLFRYVPVVLRGPNIEINTYAFLDDGSSVTLLENELAAELQLNGVPYPLCLKWTADDCRYEKDSRKVSLEISGVRNPAKRFRLDDVHTVDKLKLPLQTLAFEKLAEKHRHLKGLPVDSYWDVRPQILIGMNHVQVGRNLLTKEGSALEPIASKTRLGWIVYGPSLDQNQNVNSSLFHNFHICKASHASEDDLHKLVKSFFALDSLGISKPAKPILTSEDERALDMMRAITSLEGNRYQSGLLWKYDDVRLPNSKAMAKKRTECLQRRMAREPELAKALTEKIKDYVDKGYARKLTQVEIDEPRKRVWYMPVFPVFNPNKPGKLRIVWDAAAVSGGISLNDVLMKGPDLNTLLPSVLYKFREHPVAVSGDIREMFHQVRINEEDQHCQRFFWPNEDGSMDVYVLTVMSFGAKCSPSVAQFVKNQNAERFRDRFPVAVDIIQRSHYVDDMLTSMDTEDEAIELTKQVKMIHEAGGFEIRGWASNSTKVLAAFGIESVSEKSLDITSAVANEKVLGMWWSTKGDYFTYKVFTERNKEILTEGRRPTKCEVLRILMSIYDPLGLIACFLMLLKIVLQDVWRSGVDWKDEICDAEYSRWQQWLDFLPQLESLQIPRCYQVSWANSDGTIIQLHTFVDASECGYSAVSYFRFVNGDQIHCALVGVKCRVSPLKFISIPRLELQGGLTGGRFAASIQEGHTYDISKRFFHTDARDVLCWLSNRDHRRYSQFVAFRVSELLEITDINEWNLVTSKLNIADEVTKWKREPNLKRVINGSGFMWTPEETWRKQPAVGETLEELRVHVLSHHQPDDPAIRPELFSSWNHLLRTTAYVLRFAKLLRGMQLKTIPLLARELRAAASHLYRQAQEDAYYEERISLSCPDDLTGKRTLSKTNALFKLEPYLDDDGVMRMRGRIGACEYLDESAKHPIILPREHPVTSLVILQVHEAYHHQSHQTIINEVRRKFYIPRLRAAYAKVRRDCQECKNQAAMPRPPAMADLPRLRLAAFVRPFSYVGIDYFGPMQVVVGRRVEKRWGVLATCLTVRAIHIEVAHSLTTDSCILCLRNIIARRGTPIEIISDRGTNLVGASKELKEAMKDVNHEQLMAEFVTEETKWSFNPPASPHMGGSWERLIRSVKKFLQLILPTQRLPTDEVLRSTLIEIENIVNSRPLTYVPVDDEAAPALTPNCFLLGSTNGSKPMVLYDDSSAGLRNTWKTSQMLANVFWRKWLAEYLPEITRRSKWFAPVRPIKVGDIVIVVDPRFPRNCWPKGRVVATKLSKDGQVRSATVQTVSGLYERPAVNLAVLDVGAKESCLDQGPTTGGDCYANS